MSRILRQVTVVRDGLHNAFTDLTYWQGSYWVGYRKGTAHVSLDSSAVVAVSDDRARFREVAQLRVSGDNRDPKFVIVDDQRLAMIFPSWIGGYEKRNLQHYIAFSDNGFTWSAPQPILPRNKWLWRVRRHDGRFYGLIEGIEKRGDGFGMYMEIMTSTDLLSWESLAFVGEREQNLNESDIYFHDNGEAWVVVRGMGQNRCSWFAAADAPYTEWEVTQLDHMIHAPIILDHNDQLYVAGRLDAETSGLPFFPYLARSSMGIWKLNRGEVELNLLIPASGDCSYPGLIKDPDGRICLSYYSQHAYHSGVIEMPYRLQTEPGWDKGQLLTPSDVYFAELELD